MHVVQHGIIIEDTDRLLGLYEQGMRDERAEVLVENDLLRSRFRLARARGALARNTKTFAIPPVSLTTSRSFGILLSTQDAGSLSVASVTGGGKGGASPSIMTRPMTWP